MLGDEVRHKLRVGGLGGHLRAGEMVAWMGGGRCGFVRSLHASIAAVRRAACTTASKTPLLQQLTQMPYGTCLHPGMPVCTSAAPV